MIKNTGGLGYVGDYFLPTFMGIIISHSQDPYEINQDSMAQLGISFASNWPNFTTVPSSGRKKLKSRSET